MTTIAITGATGQLGRLVIDALLARGVPAASLVAAVRDTAKAADLAAQGVAVRAADYDQPATLDAAFAGVERLLLISSNAVGQRFAQHSAVIEAAKRAGVKLVAYTSLLHADTSPLALAAEHVATEQALAASGLPHVLLRNGWYVENYLLSVPTALQHGALLGSAGTGRISCASRADYADAAAAVLAGAADPAGQVHELAGDDSYSLAELAAEIAAQAGKPVAYNDLPEAAYKDVLVSVGLPEGFAGLLADSDAGAAKGALYDGGKGISALTGKPTITLTAAVAGALKG
ncbi:NmrA family NAD(P)-binding protein [Derxia gummosa]|uniref:NmrA family NAD(P)-binding protein n=1 Tax=Derxia gummosa DSM 723 TaxID=1121388 RepID=A0A8B6X6T3_9BURK|nr:NmrA family NAD(P)-binding protein [Derxia gummosa]